MAAALAAIFAQSAAAQQERYCPDIAATNDQETCHALRAARDVNRFYHAENGPELARTRDELRYILLGDDGEQTIPWRTSSPSVNRVWRWNTIATGEQTIIRANGERERLKLVIYGDRQRDCRIQNRQRVCQLVGLSAPILRIAFIGQASTIEADVRWGIEVTGYHQARTRRVTAHGREPARSFKIGHQDPEGNVGAGMNDRQVRHSMLRLFQCLKNDESTRRWVHDHRRHVQPDLPPCSENTDRFPTDVALAWREP